MGMRLNAALLAASLLLATEGRAQTPGEFRIYEENDSWLNPPNYRTDRYYTQGLRIEKLRRAEKSDAHFLPGISHSDWCSLVCGKGFKENNVNTGYAVGQNMYTPENILIAAPQPNDRPWAGLLYVSRIARASYEETSLKAQRQDRIEVSLGIVGPASLAGETQIGFHDLIGEDRPAGWDNQLRNEPILQLRYDTALRWPRKEGGNVDFIPRLRANLGNALTSLEADVTVRIGRNLSGFGVTSAAQPAPAASVMERQAYALRGSSWPASFNFFLRAGIKAVARNITLDGNTFARNDILIERTPLVPEFAAGVEVNLVGNFWLTYQFIHRGSEFERRKGGDAPPQRFGSVTLAFMTGR